MVQCLYFRIFICFRGPAFVAFTIQSDRHHRGEFLFSVFNLKFRQQTIMLDEKEILFTKVGETQICQICLKFD